MGKPKTKPGPDPDRLKIEGDWKEALKKAIGVKRPEGGWPKEGESLQEPADSPKEGESDR